MKTIEVTEQDVKSAFDVAKSDEMKNVLAALFCKKEKPNLNNYKSIKTYEDACVALGEEPILSKDICIGECKDYGNVHSIRDAIFIKRLPKCIIALMKLETISRALWGKNFRPKPDAEGSEHYYYPCFALYTKEEIKRFSEESRRALLSVNTNKGTAKWFGYLTASYRLSSTFAYLGFGLCQENEEKTKYFSKQFIELWAEYLNFNLTIGAHLK